MLDTYIPRRGMIVTNWSRTRRCSASRIGVRPRPSCCCSSVVADDRAGGELERHDHSPDRLKRLLAE